MCGVRFIVYKLISYATVGCMRLMRRKMLGRSHPWKPDGLQTDRNCDTTESNAEQPTMRGRFHGWVPNGLREPEKPSPVCCHDLHEDVAV